MKKRRIAIQRLFFAIIIFLLLLPIPSWGYEKEIDILSNAMADKIAKAGKKTVAVVDFTDLDGNVTQLGRFIAEELSGALAEKGQGFEVVNRSNLKLILKEHKLFEKGVIDGKAAMQLGEIAGVQALVTGTITPFTENVRLSVSVLDINTAKVIENKRENIPRTTDINELLGKEIIVEAGGQTITKKETKKTGSKQPQTAISSSFSDDFNMGPKPDWRPITGNWTMANGQYTVTDIRGEESYLTLLEGKKWDNFIMEINVTPGHVSAAGFSRTCSASICPRILSHQEKICFGISGTDHRFEKAYWFIVNKDKANGEMISSMPIDPPVGQPVRIKIEVNKGVFTSYLNGAQINQVYDVTFPSGTIGLSQWYRDWNGPRVRVAFDNLEITPLSD